MFDIFKPMTNPEPEPAMNNTQPETEENELLHFIEAKQLYNKQASHHFFVGDESAVELFNALKTIALQNDHEYFGVLELHPEYEAVLSMLKLLVDRVPEMPRQPALNAIQWMEDMHPNCWMAWQNATFYLSGGPTLISRFQQYLLKKNIASWQIRIIK